MRARHDDPLIDVERLAGEPGFLQQIGDRHPLLDASLRKLLDALNLVRLGAQLGIEGKSERP